jgi:hypothetical protein
MAVTENFYYVEGNTSVKNLVKTLVQEITQNSGIYKWDLVVPATIDQIGASSSTSNIDLITDGSTTELQTVFTTSNQDDTCIIKAITSYNKTFYVKFDRVARDLTSVELAAIEEFTSAHDYPSGTGSILHRTDAQTLEYMADPVRDTYKDYVRAMTSGQTLNNIRLQIATELNQAGDDINISTDIQERYNYRLSWYKSLQPEIGDFLPVQYWLNITKDSINIILRGDPSADVTPYQNYLTSYAYIGALKPLEDDAELDDEYNFGITTSSDVPPEFNNPYGQRTATGITDVCMIANKVGMPYQPHYPGFYTTHSFMDKCNTEGSRWNHKKHQFSDVTLVHPIDMERGKMNNILAGDASAIYDMDKLVYKKGTDDEENYKKFKITAPYNFLNNSANNLYCIAIRCYQATE